MTPYPLVEEIQTFLSPIETFESFKDDYCPYFLDSGMDPQKYGRYSFIGSDPFLVLKSHRNEILLKDENGPRQYTGNPLGEIGRLLDKYKLEPANREIPFPGGAVGYLSYDLGRLIESIPCLAEDDLGLPDLVLGFYDCGLVFDNLKSKVYAISTGFPLGDDANRQKRASRRLTELKNKLKTFPIENNSSGNKSLEKGILVGSVRSNFTREQYLEAVDRARRYIIDGDIFEVNLSQRFEAEIRINSYDLFRRLRSINPAPFSSYLGFDDVQVVCASPERFLRKSGEMIETRPIKGTRRRGKTPEEDGELALELTCSAKDMAENIMIVDLERNDLGRICRYGSVKVSELAILEKFPTVFHLTSTIEGHLRKDTSIADILQATFPGGSITGAPKIRSMEIIEELEPTRRSIYTGSIGYFGFDGDFDLNIVIRTFIVKNNKVYFQAGGAVVYDSNPEAEYTETLDKARALFDALTTSGPLTRNGNST